MKKYLARSEPGLPGPMDCAGLIVKVRSQDGNLDKQFHDGDDDDCMMMVLMAMMMKIAQVK